MKNPLLNEDRALRKNSFGDETPLSLTKHLKHVNIADLSACPILTTHWPDGVAAALQCGGFDHG